MKILIIICAILLVIFAIFIYLLIRNVSPESLNIFKKDPEFERELEITKQKEANN